MARSAVTDGAAVVVRAAASPEVPDVVAAYAWLFDPPGRRPAGWDERMAAGSILRTMGSPRSVVLVAVDGVRVVGFLTAYLDIESVRFGNRIWVEDLAVDPGHRSRGVGKRLLDAAKAWGRDRGATHLELESGEARTDAHRFYEREAPRARSRCFIWDL